MRIVNKRRFGIAIGVLVMVVILVAGTASHLTRGPDGVTNRDFMSWEVSGTVPKGVKPRSIEELWETVHKMSHHVVLADEKWGYEELSEEHINLLIIEVTEGSYKHEHSEELLDILWRWKNSDFDQADDDHNKVWNRLGGTVGKAYGVQDKTPVWGYNDSEATPNDSEEE